MKIAGFWSGHDCAFCILENGSPVVHAEYERYIREKEPAGDSVQFMFEEVENCKDIQHIATCYPTDKLTQYNDSLQKINQIIQKNDGKIYAIGHHQAHAANAFFSSNFDDALIITLDGGGIEDESGLSTACTIWRGEGNKIVHHYTIPIGEINIGGVWTRATRYIFDLQSGWPRGHQAGTVMAMAALGNPEKFEKDFYRMLTDDLAMASSKPHSQPRGANIGTDPEHPYMHKWRKLADESDQARYDLAAGLQAATEKIIEQIIEFSLQM